MNSDCTRRRAAAATTAYSMNGVSDFPSLKTASTSVRTFGSTRIGGNVAERIRYTCSKCAAIAEIEAEMPQMHASILAAVADGAIEAAAQLAVALRRHWEIDTRMPPPRAVAQAHTR